MGAVLGCVPTTSPLSESEDCGLESVSPGLVCVLFLPPWHRRRMVRQNDKYWGAFRLSKCAAQTGCVLKVMHDLEADVVLIRW